MKIYDKYKPVHEKNTESPFLSHGNSSDFLIIINNTFFCCFFYSYFHLLYNNDLVGRCAKHAVSHLSSAPLSYEMLYFSEKIGYVNPRLSAKSVFMFATPFENKLRSDQKQTRKWVLKGTTVHIALF